MPVLLSSAVSDRARRVLTCPFCSHVHLWVVADVPGSDGGGDSRTTLGSSVE
jgi:hypothetical protein